MNGGPRNDSKKKSTKLKLHEGRDKTVLPPLSDRKGKAPRGLKAVQGKGGDKALLKSNVDKEEAGKDKANDPNKLGLNVGVVLKIESDRTGDKGDANKNDHNIIASGGPPRTVNIIETMGLSPRKASKLERKISAL